MRTLRTFLAVAVATVALATAAADASTPVTLRAAPVASGPAVTLGDLFDGAGTAASEAIAPAPAPGTTAPLSARFVAAAAEAAGLSWTPPAGLERIEIGRAGSVRAASARAVAAGAAATGAGSTLQQFGAPRAAAAVRRGETIALVYEAPGIRITANAKALGDGAAGETIRVQNTQSNRIIDARVTASGAATALGPAS